jgi:hypothetical protein
MKRVLIIITAFLLFPFCSDKKGEPLFNGKDLSGWYSYLAIPDSSIQSDLPRDSAGHYFQALGLNNDIFNVFTVVEEDKEPAIRISGEVFGILVTENEYENYHLTLDVKWGEKKYAPRADKKRDSGVLYHSVGPEGAWGGVWMKSKECQVQETDIGDFIVVDTGVAVIPCIFDSLQNLYYYNEKGIPLAFTVKYSYCHKSGDYEKKHGEWNTLEIYTLGENSVHVVNGNVNMRAYHSNVSEMGKLVSHTRGKIQIQSEGAEVYYRNIRIEPITELPEGIGMELKKGKR